jgi:hypothetical protein
MCEEVLAMKARPDPYKKIHKGHEARRAGKAELSRELAVETVPDAGLEVSICADASERAALAKRYSLVAVASLAADLRVSKKARSRFTVTGNLRAHVTQTCVVSLEPFESEIETDIEVDFGEDTPAQNLARPGYGLEPEKTGSPPISAQSDAPDPIVDGFIDLGALATEFLVLSLDPYPRKPGVRFEDLGYTGDQADSVSPFAALKKLKE